LDIAKFCQYCARFALICQSYRTLPSFGYVVPRIIESYQILPSFAKVIELYKVFTKLDQMLCQCYVQILLSFAEVIEFNQKNLEQSTLKLGLAQKNMILPKLLNIMKFFQYYARFYQGLPKLLNIAKFCKC
jgi:hypothetical protein